MITKYSHYFKDVRHLTHIDVYRILDLYDVQRGSVAHALKKLLCAGGRGAKNYTQDIIEARDALNRELQMLDEDDAVSDGPGEEDGPWADGWAERCGQKRNVDIKINVDNQFGQKASAAFGVLKKFDVVCKVSAGEFSREQLHAAGWTDESIEKHGVKVKSESAEPPQPHPFYLESNASKREALLKWLDFTDKVSAAILEGLSKATSAWNANTGSMSQKDEAAAVVLRNVFRKDYGDCLKLWLETRQDLLGADYLEFTKTITVQAAPISAYDTYREISKSQPMMALYARVKGTHRSFGNPIFDMQIFNFL